MKNRRKMTVIKALVCTWISLMLATSALANANSGNQRVPDFETAKRLMMEHLYAGGVSRVTLYCGCTFDARKRVDATACGIPANIKFKNRRNRVEFEHATPASYGNHFACYREAKQSQGGRRPDQMSSRDYCRNVDPAYARMEADAHNLFPSVGSINAIRWDKSYGVIPGEKREFGPCDFESNDKLAEPRDVVVGDVARATLYMSDVYGIRISRKNRQLFEAWNKMDPPDAFEKWRNRKILGFQGNTNHWIDKWGK